MSLAAVAAAVLAATSVAPHQVSVVRDPRIDEQSDLAVSRLHPGLVWTTNDSGDTARVFGVDVATGRTRAVLRLRCTATDVESMAPASVHGRSLLWVGDTGDNRGDRRDVVLRLVDEPARLGDRSAAVTSLRLRYPGGPVDVEALVWLPAGRLLLVTKELLHGRVLEVPPAAVRAALAGHPPSGRVLVRQVATVPQTLVTDAAATPDGRVVVRDYLGAVVYRAPAGGRMTALASVPLPRQRQGESIAVSRTGSSAYVGSEGVRQPLWQVALPAAPRPAPRPTSGVARATRAVEQRARTRPVGTLLAVGGGAVVVALVALLATGARRRGRRTP